MDWALLPGGLLVQHHCWQSIAYDFRKMTFLINAYNMKLLIDLMYLVLYNCT